MISSSTSSTYTVASFSEMVDVLPEKVLSEHDSEGFTISEEFPIIVQESDMTVDSV